MECIFCKIVNKEIPADVVYEDEKFIGFKDIKPEAVVHLIFIPKKHIEWNDEFTEEDLSLLSGLIVIAKKVAKEKNIFDACKLIFNVGKTGDISHIHLHLLGGWKENIPMHNI